MRTPNETSTKTARQMEHRVFPRDSFLPPTSRMLARERSNGPRISCSRLICEHLRRKSRCARDRKDRSVGVRRFNPGLVDSSFLTNKPRHVIGALPRYFRPFARTRRPQKIENHPKKQFAKYATSPAYTYYGRRASVQHHNPQRALGRLQYNTKHLAKLISKLFIIFQCLVTRYRLVCVCGFFFRVVFGHIWCLSIGSVGKPSR